MLFGLEVFVIILSSIGLYSAFKIWKDKRKEEEIICPLKFHCDRVVRSDYSKFFGLPIEILGILYYLFILFAYLLFLIFPVLHQMPFLQGTLLILTSFAFLFSLYLIGIQAVALKNWCSWCLISAGASTLIFIVALDNTTGLVASSIYQYRSFILALHVLGVVIGMGAATVADFIFIKFLKDLKISIFEQDVLKNLSQVIWFGLSIVVVSGAGLFLSDISYYSSSSKFIMKMLIVLIIILNAFILNFVITPKLTKINFGEIVTVDDKKLRNLRRLAFASGAVSIISWYFAFLLGLVKVSFLSFGGFIFVYFVILLIAVIISQIVEARILKIEKLV